MREALAPYKGHERLNYLCLISTEMLGENRLDRMPALLSGFEGIIQTLPVDIAQALKNVRLAGFAPGTRRELALMADIYRTHYRRLDERRARGEDIGDGFPQRFEVTEDLRVRKLWTHLVPDDVRQALIMLNSPLPVRGRVLRDIHDGTQPAEINHDSGYNAFISPLGFMPPDPPVYDLTRIGRAPGKIAWKDLVELAKEFDRLDVEAERQAPGSHSWYRRLHDADGLPTARLLEAGAEGLSDCAALDLTGMKHLIGLPGAGKTTVLYLLATYLARNGLRACFLFPSIEVATGFIETLSLYGVQTGLLSGQGESSRNRHVLNFATSLAAHHRGFGETRSVAPLFATNCALAGYASDEESEFPHYDPPCLGVMQRGGEGRRARAHQCALSSVCGYQHGERVLAEAPIWAGHILSMDRGVSKLYSDTDIRHFEFIARTFDLLVVDECDGAQCSLDSRGTPIMKLVGDSESLWSTLIRDIHQPAAGGRNAFMSGETLPTLLEMTGRFGRAAERLLGRITHLPNKFKNDNANILHTSLSLLADMYEDDRFKGDAKRREAQQAIERIWDVAVKRVAFRHTIEDDDGDEDPLDLERTISEAAELLRVEIDVVRDFHDQLTQAIERWERDGNDMAVRGVADVMRSAPDLSSPLDDENFFHYCGLLVSVSLVVLQHFGLAPHLRLMNAEGLVSDSVFESRPSRDQMAILPESLIGRMSGVRYTISEEGNVDVSHVSFAGTPRTLPHRMIRLGEEDVGGGMAVLLTSATSMLEQSPSYHVAPGPHYVLQRPNAGDGWKRSRYAFLPMRDPQDGVAPLRFSGAKMTNRDAILRAMVDGLLKDGMLSHVSTAIAENDVVDGIPRKVGFVVNSYEQCRIIYQHIEANHPAWRGKARYLVQATIHGNFDEHAVTAAEVEQLGEDPAWDLLVFPMNAIGRGVNIVFRHGPRQNKAMIGSLFFLTRPHPRGDSLQLIQGLVGRASEQFDRRVFPDTETALTELNRARKDANHMAEYLLRLPLVSQRLGPYAEPFVADQMIIILQTIGRAMRGDCPAFVYFVDAAWAPNSALGQAETEKSSMLVMMQSILSKCLTHPDLSRRECYQNLYESFSEPLGAISNLIRSL